MLYLDPGTGSLVVQVVIAALVTVRVTSRDAWSRMKGWITRKKRKDPPR